MQFSDKQTIVNKITCIKIDKGKGIISSNLYHT